MKPFAWLSCPDPKLAEALGYLAQHPGKQLRSRLTVTSAELVSGESVPAAVMAGEAIELLHTYSLVHDDLPAMDDDDLRRGQPTLHRAFDEATAILAGDGLQAAAFQRLTEIEALSAEQRLDVIGVVTKAVGFHGMVGGQALDLAAEHQAVPVTALKDIHNLKTGALISAAAEVGAICGGATRSQREALVRFAKASVLPFKSPTMCSTSQATAPLWEKQPARTSGQKNPPTSARWAWKVHKRRRPSYSVRHSIRWLNSGRPRSRCESWPAKWFTGTLSLSVQAASKKSPIYSLQ